MIWRVLARGGFASGLVEIETQWTLNDLIDADAVIDALEEAEAPAT